MPNAQMGSTLPIDSRGLFIDLKAKGESVTVRFATAEFYYDGKHFTKDENTGKWVVTSCPRINEDAPCDMCDKFFELKKLAKESKKAGDKVGEEDLNNKARAYGAKVSFYYPVLDRETGMAKIFKTSLSVRLKLEDFLKAGTNVLGSDFTITRTERTGADYYTVIRVDSAEVKPFSEKDTAELQKAKEFVLGDIIENVKQSELSLEQAEGDDIVIPEDFGQAGEGDVKLDQPNEEMPF